MTQQIEAILFDVGGTLRNSVRKTEEARNKAIRQIIEVLKADAAVDEFDRLLNERADAYKQWADASLKELSEEDLWTKWMLPDWPEDFVRTNAVTLNQLYRDSLSTRVVFPETYEVITSLFRRGYRLGLVSNTTSSVEVPALLKEMRIIGCFETLVLSTVIGMRKPDPDILLEAVKRMGVAPERCAYIGDQPNRDVAAARRAGFAKAVIIRQGNKKPGLHLKDPFLVPDHKIHNLMELLDIFPERNPIQPAKVYNVSLSTMWLKNNFPTLPDFFEFARRTGFAHVELNHKIDSEMLKGIDLGKFSISSLHEPCPADIPMETLVKQDWVISAVDEDNRKKGVAAVKRSIDLAHQWGLSMIVVHPGHVVMDVNLEKRLRRLIQEGKEGSEEFNSLKAEMVSIRAALAPAAFDSLKKSICELVEYARPYHVRLGLENRYHYREFPNQEEMETLLQLGEPEILGVTFDVGHAMHLARLGFHPYNEWLTRFSSRIFETHLHDFRGITDHYAAGLGDVDFDEIAAHLPENAIRTCEFIDTNTPEQVISALKYLHEHGCIKTI